MKVKDLYIYPIKSLQGIKVSNAMALEKGFEHDRRWMLVDEHGTFITQRKHPNLSQFIVSKLENGFLITSKDHKSIEVPHTLKQGDITTVTIWDTKVKGIKAPSPINEWFSNILNINCSLVFMPEDTKRAIDSEGKETVSFADGYPYLIVGESAMKDLNLRLDEPLPILRFRPNIVFEGGEPYEEDHWENFTIGSLSFRGAKPCIRCVFTTIDQTTGAIGKEPLRTLATYRAVSNGVIFGLNAIALNQGRISIGDPITALSKKPF